MIKTIHIQTTNLEDNGLKASWLDGNAKANNKTIVDGEHLAKEIEKQVTFLVREGYQILNILPITSEKVEAHSLRATFTSSVIITGIKTK
ncbi:MAG: hypothetical protein WC141_09205 [Arcobacteraceae bacterium]